MTTGKNLFLFCGDDRYLVEDGARELVQRLVPGHEREFGLDVIDGNCTGSDDALKAVHSCRESLCTESFFGGKKTTWLRDAAFLGGNSRGDGSAKERASASDAISVLVSLVKNGIPEGHTLIISCRKINRASALYKAIAAIGEVNDFGNDLKPREKEQLAFSVLAKYLDARGVTMSPDAREFFLQRVGSDSGTLIKELDKLVLSAHPRSEIKVEDVQEMTSLSRETVAWEFLEAFDSKDVKKTLLLLAGYEGQRGMGIMLTSMLEKNVRELIAVRFAIDNRWIVNGQWSKQLSPEVNVLLESSPINPANYNSWKLRKIAAFAQKFTEAELRIARHILNELRQKLVSSSLPEFHLLQCAILQIMKKR